MRARRCMKTGKRKRFRLRKDKYSAWAKNIFTGFRRKTAGLSSRLRMGSLTRETSSESKTTTGASNRRLLPNGVLGDTILAMRSIENALRWIVIGGVFLLPFVATIVAGSLFFPYITGKNFAFRIIVEIVTGAWLALALVNAAYRPRRTWILGAFGAFILIMAAANLFGEYPFKSTWSNFERMDGWITIAHVFAYTVVAASVLTTERIWRWLLWTTLGVLTYLAIYGFLQVAGVTALGQASGAGLAARIDATFGNPIYFAAYMLFHIFIAALLWAQSWVARGTGNRLAPSLSYGSIIVLDTAALFLTGTRGTVIGLIGGALLSALILVVFARNSRNVWRFAVGMVVALLVTVGGFWSIRDAAWINDIGFLDRLSNISLTEQTVQARFVNWSIAWQGVKEKPILGWGQENYALVFDKYYDPRMYQQEQWFDRVHNIVFDWLVAGGFLGLVSYLSIFAAALWAIWRSGAFRIAERAILTGLLAAYFTHNFFVFDNITSYILFGTILAYIIFRAHPDAPTLLEAKSMPRRALPYVTFGAAMLVWGVAWYANAGALAQNRALITGLAQNDAAAKLENFKKAIAYESYGTQEAREQLAQAAAQVVGSSLPNALKQDYFNTATREMTLQADESPLDARFPLFLGGVYEAYGDHERAKAAYERALELSPAKQTIMYQLGQNAFTRSDTAGALAYYQQAHEIAAQFLEPKLMYAAALITANQFATAESLLAPHIESGEAAHQRILAAYVEKKRYSEVARIWQAYIAANPGDVQAYFTLAAVYYEAGDNARTIQVLQQAGQAHPQIKQQADALIEQVRTGTVR